MNKNYACCSFLAYGLKYPCVVVNSKYNENEKNLIIKNVVEYIDYYIEYINLEKFKLLVFFNTEFIILNISLIVYTLLSGYIIIPFCIDENEGLLFDKNILVFDTEKWINDDLKKKSIKKINYTESQIIFVSPKKDNFITVEENGTIHLLSYIEENNNLETHLNDKNYYFPLYINSMIDFIEEIQYYDNYNKKCNFGIVIIYENGIISFISKTKILFGMTYFNLKNIRSQFLKISINLNNIFSINYRCLNTINIKTFDYYFLESLLRCVIEKKTINMFIVKNIMLHLYNNEYSLILLNILIKDYLEMHIN